MNASQLHERLRLEVLRHIERGTLDRAILARRTGLTPPHISNFLNSKKRLSLASMDKILEALRLGVPELLSKGRGIPATDYTSVPLVDPISASMNATIALGAILEDLKVRSGLLSGLRDKCSADRRKWDRWVAVKIADEEAGLMQPVLPKGAILLIDRHYNSTVRYSPDARNIYAVRSSGLLRFRYVALVRHQLVLTAHKRSHPPELLRPAEHQGLSDFLVGRVFLIVAER